MRNARVDENQKEIVSILRQYPGVSVVVTSSFGNGMSDLIVGYSGLTYLFEIKVSGRRDKLTPDEKKFRAEWRGHYDVAVSADEILFVLGLPNELTIEEKQEFLSFREHVFP